jgi:PAS domain S-box-containing protein/diguanylate cyclase (GGDEF)-like protein
VISTLGLVESLLLTAHAASKFEDAVAQLAEGLIEPLGVAAVSISFGPNLGVADSVDPIVEHVAGSKAAVRALPSLSDAVFGAVDPALTAAPSTASGPSAPARGGRRGGGLRTFDEPRSWAVRDTSGVLVGVLSTVGVVGGPGASPRGEAELATAIALTVHHLGILYERALATQVVQHEHLRFQIERDERRLATRAFELVFEESAVGMATVSLDPGDAGRFLSVNDALCRITGRSADELTAMTFSELTHPDDRRLSESALRRAMSGRRTPFRMSKRYLRADGEPTWVQITSSPLFDDLGEPFFAITQILDLSPRQEVEIERARQIDGLTGLLNRGALDRSLEDVLERARRLGTTAAVLVCDIGSTSANGRGLELLDDDDADALRIAVAEVLGRTARNGDILSRIGVNRFVVVAEEVRPEHAEVVAERLATALETAPGGPNVHRFRADIGVAILTPTSTDPATLLSQADIAMQRAREQGKSHALYARPDAGDGFDSTQLLWARPGHVLPTRHPGMLDDD